ncbi:MAG: hypothetical protein JXQ71_02855 [Verrucomicrobia bacterium]|nr:hypothetical protein [Verrucomicrobiota bacterium]
MKTHNTKSLRSVAALIAAVGFGFMLTGCTVFTGGGGKPVAWDLELTANTDVTITRLDVIGINLLEKQQQWDSRSVDEYWSTPNNPLRAGAERLTFKVIGRKIELLDKNDQPLKADPTITGTGTSTVRISRKHPLWNTWLKNKNDEGLVLIGSFPIDKPRKPDLRKITVPLYRGCWTKGQPLRIEIQNEGFYNKTIPSDDRMRILQRTGFGS